MKYLCFCTVTLAFNEISMVLLINISLKYWSELISEKTLLQTSMKSDPLKNLLLNFNKRNTGNKLLIQNRIKYDGE